MKLSHQHQRHSLVTTERGQRDRGYVLVQFALLLVPLLLMVGLSVDVGYWYNRAADIQKAADAAALAGVVWLPDVPEARSRAREAAARNGFAHDPDGTGITVLVDPVAGTTRQLRVTIEDPRVGSFFFQSLGGSTIDLTREATGEYILPVPLGSPENVFGNDVDLPPDQRAGLWGNIHGPQTNNHKGDAYAAGCRRTVVRPNGTTNDVDGCTTFEETYRPEGYLYTIDVPEGVSNMAVQVYDAGLYPRTNETIDTGDASYNNADQDAATTGTQWTFYERNATELDVSDNLPATACTTYDGAWVGGEAVWEIPENADAATFRNRWATICQKGGGVTPGRYLLRVKTTGGAGANRFSIRAKASSATQPRVAAYGDFSMYNNINGGSANFFLAEVVPEHRGKTLELKMYDPGEVSQVGPSNARTGGNGLMKVMSPAGAVAARCVGDSNSPNSSFTSGSTLSPCQFVTATNGVAKYNGYWLSVAIKIPNDYDCTPGLTSAAGCWWKIRYEIDGQGNDTTTWAAQVIGDPVHLVEEEAP